MAYRIERVNSLIRQEISDLIQHQAKDPRLGSLVSVTEVSTSADLKYARVFISGICNKEEREETISVLGAASGFLRNKLAHRLRLRHIPELDFRWDDSIEKGAHLLELIDRVTGDEDKK
ncbi:MAG TPA: 30S ribosome-binding factor RbfA [Dehalococcoidia bacterium]|nr:30S ribosome-binding factor RbfA [Dehalococcoidia bacterium]